MFGYFEFQNVAKDARGPGLKNYLGLVRDLNPGPLAP